ncbi:MAG TPA: RNA methyltransferase [Burkholderiales bacterium]|jgi:tRNA/rRNA methyltransferase|nr:RNA methyltransferase [Burkholderiales bacterium]
MTNACALQRVRIVLCRTSHPGNIGAAARAMKTMGLSRLFLVRPERFPHPDAEAFAAGALDVLESAARCDSLDQALHGTVLAVASTARRRDLAYEALDCREACARLVLEAQDGEVALVFGPERSGLTMQDVDKCRLIATIRTDPAYPSLNLAQAVQVFAYELRMHAASADAPRAGAALATHEQLERFYAQLEHVAAQVGFLDARQPRRMMRRLRRVFARARLEEPEANILIGLLNAVRTKVE